MSACYDIVGISKFKGGNSWADGEKIKSIKLFVVDEALKRKKIMHMKNWVPLKGIDCCWMTYMHKKFFEILGVKITYNGTDMWNLFNKFNEFIKNNKKI